MVLTKDTGVKLSIATLLAVLIWMGGASWKVFGYVQTIAANTVAIQSVSKSLQIGRLTDEIGDLRREKRNLKRVSRKDPTDELLKDQLVEIDDEIEVLKEKLECVTDGNRICE